MMEIPQNVHTAMRDGEVAYQRLMAQRRGHRAWTKEQETELSLMFDILSNTYNALKRLIDANTDE